MNTIRKPPGIPDAFDDPPTAPGQRLIDGWLKALNEAVGMWNIANWHPVTRPWTGQR